MNQPLYTKRLILREVKETDTKDLFDLLCDDEVTRFLPMFSLQTFKEAKAYQANIMKKQSETNGMYYAICLKEDDRMIGYVTVGEADSYDFGYALGKQFWHQGIVSEAAQAVLQECKRCGLPYVTATHDIQNPRSGSVMKALGMKYCYSYEELWQPKNIPVTFRMYQLNFDGSDHIYLNYWNRYPHCIEKLD